MRPGLPAAAVLAALLAAAPAHAAGLSGMGANLFGNYFHFGSKPNISRPMVKAISVGSFRMELQHTKLAQIQKAFGGAIQSQGGAGTLARWLCYHTDGSKGPAANTWFISNILGGGEFVMIVAVQAADPKRIPADCEAAPAKFEVPDLGIPGLGSSSSDLRATFGSASGSTIAYRADAPGADALGTANNAQYIGYTMSSGKVTGFGAGETSVPVGAKN